MARVLIVDDDPDVLEAARVILEREGHAIQTAPDRAAGLREAKAFGPDLIVLDVMMEQPDDGIALAQDLRAGGCTVPIIMLTSISRISGMSYGRDDERNPVDVFLEKPIKPAAFVGQVAALLGRKEADDHAADRT